MDNKVSSSDSNAHYCQECGEKLVPDNQFCGNCGAEQFTSQSQGQSSDEEDYGASWKSLSDVSVGKKLGLSGTALIIVGAFLPWYSVQLFGSSITKAGVDGDGVLTLLLGVIALIVIARSKVQTWGKKTWLTVIVVGGFVTLLGLIYIGDPWAFSEPPSEEAQQLVNIGMGLYLTVLGGIMTLGGPIYDKYS